MTGAADVRGRRSAGIAGLFVAAVLLATVDVRAYGLIPDGREMLSAAAAVARFLEIGVSRDFANAPRRPAGDAVSRYGMGLSLLEAVPASVARASGAARTASLFVLIPILCLAGCAWAAARTLLALGLPRGPAVLAGAALVFATPLWGYASSDYGEPLQALCVALVILALVELRLGPPARRWQVLLGLASGLAILTKTLLVLVVAPLLVAAMLPRRVDPEEKEFLESKTRAARRRAAREAHARRDLDRPTATGFAPPWPLLLSFTGTLSVWLFFELSRFGKVGGGYEGETFAYPFLTGLLRLTVLPNKGLLWYAPVVLFAVPGFLSLRRRDARLAWALSISTLALVAASSGWWAWDGQAGWGPRLVLPALPAILVLAGFALNVRSLAARVAAGAAVAVGIVVNALGALVPFPCAYVLASQVAPQPIAEARAAGTPYEIARGADGGLLATGPHHLSLTPAWSPIRVHALVLSARLRGGWDGALPELDPPFRPRIPPVRAPALRLALSAPRPGWGREFFEREGRGEAGPSGSGGWADPYRDALRDQLVRAIDMKDYARARKVGSELTGREEKIASSDSRTVALVAETLRLGGGGGGEEPEPRDPTIPSGLDSGAAASLSYLSKKSLSISPSSGAPFDCNPWVLFVRAMAAPPGDFSCLPEGQRAGFAASVDAARARGWPLTAWSRAAFTGRP